MTASPTEGRPRQVTAAVPVAIVGSVLLIVVLFQTTGTLQNADTRKRVSEFLSKPPGDELAITVDQVLSALRALLVVNAILAAVVAVFAIFALQRHRGARLGQSIAGGLLLVTGALSGTLVPVVIAAATALLWTRPAREWYGRGVPGPRSTAPTVEPVLAPPMGPRMSPPMNQPVSRPVSAPAAELEARPPVSGPASGRLPGSVIAAAAITWVFSGITMLAYLAVVVLLLADSERLVEAAQRQTVYTQLNLSSNDFLGIIWVASVVMIAWCLAAIVCAALMLRRQRWARIALVVSAGFALPLSLIAVPVGWVNVVGEVLMIVLVFSRAANAWFAGRPTPSYPAKGGPPGNVW